MKKLLSIFLVLTMIFTLVPMNIFAENAEVPVFSDMNEADYYAEAATTLAQLGILSGYPDGTFGADKPITRAEMAAVVCRMINMEADAVNAKGETSFDDVSNAHWASGYINVASQKSIINGDGNGKFRPEDNVLYEEAIKMVVCALGYGDGIVVEPDDWSKGYLEVASNKNISDNLKGTKGSPSTRGDVAVMSYNGLASQAKVPATPVASKAAGEYTGTQKVKLSTSTEGAVIYYTTDGKTPTEKSTKYTKEITIAKTLTLKAIAVKDGVVSDVLSVDYTIKSAPSGGGGGGGGGGGSTTTKKYTVSFDLNYDGATGAPASQSVAKNKYATEPEEPVREGYIFDGWYIDEECTMRFDFTNTSITRATTLYANWFSNLYGIYEISLNDTCEELLAIVSTDEACKIMVTAVDTDTSDVLYQTLNDVDANLELSEITVDISNWTLPEYFLLKAVLVDNNGKTQCETHTCIDYTPEYEEFMSKTIYDFDEEDVVNFDDSETMNFAVLNENVEKIEISDDLSLMSGTDDKNVINEENSDFLNNYFEIENIDDSLRDTCVGDILYFEYDEGFIITVAQFEIVDDTLKVWGSMSCELIDYFDYIKVEMELDPDEYEEVELPEYNENEAELMAEIVDVDVSISSLKVALPIELSVQNRAETRTGTFKASVSAEIKPKLTIKWDAHLFAEDYFEFKLSLETTTGIDAALEYSRTNGQDEVEIEYDEMLEKVASIPMGKVLIPFGVTGLGATVELTVPISIEFKASANFSSTTTTTSFISYDTVNGAKSGKETKNSKSFTVEGEVEVKVGPKLEESITFLKEVVKASLTQHGGVYLDIKADLNIENTDHLCVFCASGEFGLFLTASGSISYKITDNFKGTPFSYTFYDGKWKLVDCHYSSISGFGFGDCPNVSSGWDGHCTLTGKITIADRDTDNTNNQPLKGATVKIEKVGSTNTSASTVTSNDGTYTIENIPVGDYTITVSKQNYITVTQSISITEATVNMFNTTIEAISEEDEGEGTATGIIYDAVTGAGVKDIKMVIRKGLNNLVGDVVKTVYSSDNGEYTTGLLAAGNYTIQLVDERNLSNEEERYYQTSFTIKVLGNSTIPNQNGAVTNGLTADQLRIVLRWGETPYDLDSHIVGPGSDGDRFHVFYANQNYYESDQKMVDLDLDDRYSYGPETTTIYTPVSGSYTFFVHDFTNRNSTSSTALSNSGAYVEVYLGTAVNAAITFYVPNGIGTLWSVFRYDHNTGKIEPINTMSNHSNPTDIGMYGLDSEELDEDVEIVFESILECTK